VDQRIVAPVRRAVLVISLIVAFASVVLPASASAQRCGHVHIATRHLNAKVRIVHGPLKCAFARKLISAAYHAVDTRKSDGYNNTYGVFWRVKGWRCFTGLAQSQLFCGQRHKETDGSLRSDDGWSF
jgi:hypothetical protein